MHNLSRVIAVTIVLLSAAPGCRSTAPVATSLHRWGWEDADHAKAYVDAYKHVLLACIYEDDWQDQGPHRSVYRFKATVVRTYKGDWRTSDRILFAHGSDSPVTPGFTSSVGKLRFLFTDQHTENEIGFDTGTFYSYEPELERVIDFLFPGRETR
jgi:hypothetical protein